MPSPAPSPPSNDALLPAVEVSEAGRPSAFTTKQKSIINSYLPAWHKLAIVDGGALKGRSAPLAKWKKDTANRILEDDEFQRLPAGLDKSSARERIIRVYTNYRGRRSKANQSNAENDALKAAAASIVDLKAYSKGKAVFVKQNKNRILKRRDELMQREGLVSVAAYQKATKQLWNEEDDHEYWEAKGEDLAQNIFENQKLFHSEIYSTLRGLCQAGGVGPMEMYVLYAFRGQKGEVRGHSLQVHHREGVPDFDVCEGILGLSDKFGEWASDILPEHGILQTGIKTNDDGVPIFPDNNLGDLSPNNMKQLVIVYLERIWSYCRPDVADIPWEIIATEPATYYDVKKYSLSTTIRHPVQLSVTETCKLAEELQNLSKSSPFLFYPEDPDEDFEGLEGDPEVEVQITDQDLELHEDFTDVMNQESQPSSPFNPAQAIEGEDATRPPRGTVPRATSEGMNSSSEKSTNPPVHIDVPKGLPSDQPLSSGGRPPFIVKDAVPADGIRPSPSSPNTHQHTHQPAAQRDTESEVANRIPNSVGIIPLGTLMGSSRPSQSPETVPATKAPTVQPENAPASPKWQPYYNKEAVSPKARTHEVTEIAASQADPDSAVAIPTAAAPPVNDAPVDIGSKKLNVDTAEAALTVQEKTSPRRNQRGDSAKADALLTSDTATVLQEKPSPGRTRGKRVAKAAISTDQGASNGELQQKKQKRKGAQTKCNATKDTPTTRKSARGRPDGTAQQAVDNPGFLPLPTAGQKRSAPDGDDEFVGGLPRIEAVELKDGRKGTVERSKFWEGGYFMEAGGKRRKFMASLEDEIKRT